MSDIRKWLKIMESVPPVIATAPQERPFERDATVVISPRVGGGVGRFMEYTAEGNAIIDIKGIAKELTGDDFSMPERGLENGNDWFHMSVTPDTEGTSDDQPEFRPGDMVKIADVYGTVIGPGFGVFVGYGTTGEDCIILFDGKQIVVPVENVAAVLEQDAKDNFDEMDNDGNLSPMSFGSDNVKIEEPAMDNRDQFSKWMSTVEEALSGAASAPAEELPIAECGCGAWNCGVCFPEDDMGGNPDPSVVIATVDVPDGETFGHSNIVGGHNDTPMDNELEMAMNNIEADEMGLEEVGMFDEDDDAVSDFLSKGGKPVVGKYHEPRKSEVTFPGSAHIGGPGDPMRSSRTGNAANTQGLPVVGMKRKMEEEPMDFVEKPSSGKGVKLGDIVKKTEFRPAGGPDSPLTYGEENLGEEGWYDPSSDDVSFDEPAAAEMDVDFSTDADTEDDFGSDEHDMVATIKYMQMSGLSNASKNYSDAELNMMPAELLRQVHSEVTGNVAEETKPTKTRHHLDDIEDLFAPQDANPLATVDGPESDSEVSSDEPMKLPAASADATRGKLRGMTPSDTMRDFMSRIHQDAGGAEPELPDTPTDQLVVRTAQDVPAVISNAMQASGMQTPEWHNVNNLPGFQDRNVRGMGRSIFGMFTSTPVERIQTIANVEGQGPNTDAELRAVAGWLRDNAEDLGEVDVSHGMAIPGYTPDVKEYRANGVRFHVVRDPMGQYIYAYPDADARLGGPPQDGAGNRLPGGRNNPRLGEDILRDLQPTLFEQIKWDEEIREALAEIGIDEAYGKPSSKERKERQKAGYEKRATAAKLAGEEPPEPPKEDSQLARKMGKLPGGRKLVAWMHGRHRLDNEADLHPMKITNADIHRPLWTEFKRNGDNFVIISAENGVAGIKPYTKYIQDRTEEYAKKGKVYNPSGDSTVPYQIVAFTDDGQQVDPELLKPDLGDKKDKGERFGDPTVSKARMGKIAVKDVQNTDNAFELLSNQIGRLRTIWVTGVDTSDASKQAQDQADAEAQGGDSSINRQAWRKGAVPRDLMKKRADLKKASEPSSEQATETLFKKVRPVLKTLSNQAILQINRRAQRYIEGGNFEAAQKIAASGAKLKQFMAAIDTSGDVNLRGHENPAMSALKKAIATAAGSNFGSDGYNEFVKSAATGNSAALKPVLDAFRDSLVAL